MSKSVKHENPYRAGLYHDVFGFLKGKQVVTKAEMLAHTISKLGKTVEEATAAVTVILSPRSSSKRGDCRGNISAQGHLYFMEKLPRQMKAGVKDAQKFRLRWRAIPLEARTRMVKMSKPAEKVVKEVASVTSPAKVE